MTAPAPAHAHQGIDERDDSAPPVGVVGVVPGGVVEGGATGGIESVGLPAENCVPVPESRALPVGTLIVAEPGAGAGVVGPAGCDVGFVVGGARDGTVGVGDVAGEDVGALVGVDDDGEDEPAGSAPVVSKL